MTDPGSPLVDFLQTMAVLGGILALAWAALRYWLPKLNGSLGTQGQAIEVIARRPLEPRKTLYIVRVGSKTMLIAASGDNVTLLDQVEMPPAADAAPTFAEQLRGWRKA